MTTDLVHAPNCSDHEGTSTIHGHSSTTVRCLSCGAIASERHRYTPPRIRRGATTKETA